MGSLRVYMFQFIEEDGECLTEIIYAENRREAMKMAEYQCHACGYLEMELIEGPLDERW